MESRSKPKIRERVLHTLPIDNFQGTIAPPETGWRSQVIKLHFQLGNHNIEPGQLYAPQRVRSFFETAGEPPLEDLTWFGTGRRGEGYRVRSWGIAPAAQAFTDAQTASTLARTPSPREALQVSHGRCQISVAQPLLHGLKVDTLLGHVVRRWP